MRNKKNCCIQLKNKPDLDEDFFRYMLLNCIRFWKTQFPEFGEMVICDDGDQSWRKDIFPHYKASRKVARKKSSIDWSKVFPIMNKVKAEIAKVVPYRFIRVETAEADDAIAAGCKVYHKQDILILSSDKDFKQLHRQGVRQFAPVGKKWVECDNPKVYLVEHILTGDSVDGIPNYLSDDDVFVTEGKRQKPLKKKTIKEILDGNERHDPDYDDNFKRNALLIDLECFFSDAPKETRMEMKSQFQNPIVGSMESLQEYLEEHDIEQLLKKLGDFQ
jgi:5'-3' exonuclease